MSNKTMFKAESKRLLDLMIHSIYTHKEIFLRELISNASDAMDKVYFNSLSNDQIHIDSSQLRIKIELDQENRRIILTDTGIGMTKDELEDNLGTIAKSGSFDFKSNMEEKVDNVDIIGQFGVGFYSAFMVAKKVTVVTKSAVGNQAYMWVSEGEDGYIITETEKDTYGTTITLELRENTDDENYDEYTDEYTIKNLVKKYSDYIRYPIVMDVTKVEPKLDSEGNPMEGETVSTVVEEVINSMVPLWKKSKNEITEEEYNDFYKSKFNDWENPQHVIHTKAEGTITYNALLFIPSRAPYDFYSQDFERGLQLYTKGVFIMDKSKDLIGEHFRFVRGLVDTDDISLNISREMLQHNRQLKVIAKNIEKKIKNELLDMLKNDREKYNEFYKNFGLNLKYGIYNEFGAKKDLLKDLIMFTSSHENKLVTLNEYVERMKTDQEFIYFASGDSVAQIEKLPQIEKVKDYGYEVLYFTDDIDEFAIQMLMEFEGKQFKNVNQGDLNLETEEEKKELEEKANESKDLLSALKDALSGKVKEVKLSSRLKTHPVCLVSEEGISFEMEKVLSAMPTGNNGVHASRILEINPNHAIFTALSDVYAKDQSLVNDYADLLYSQALLIEGFTLEDPVAFSNKLCDLMVKANQ